MQIDSLDTSIAFINIQELWFDHNLMIYFVLCINCTVKNIFITSEVSN